MLGGLGGLLRKKFAWALPGRAPKKAMFWKRID